MEVAKRASGPEFVTAHPAALAARHNRGQLVLTEPCTTFPCHGCARHIIAAGISEVVFIEPYPKSLTGQLYEGEIEIANKPLKADVDRTHLERVRFRPFHGVAPILYQRVFAYRDRKDEYGTIATWDPRVATPVGAILGVERASVETAASQSVAAIVELAKASFRQNTREKRDAEAITSKPDS